MSNLRSLVSQLDDDTLRRAAISALIDLGSAAVEEISKEMFSTKSFKQKVYLAFVLGKIGDRRAIPALFEIAKTLPDRNSYLVIQALRRLSATDQIIDLYKNFSEKPREVVVEKFGQVGDKRSIEFLKQALSDPNERVRASVIDRLSQIGGFSDFGDIEPSLNDPAKPVWEAALRAGLILAPSQTSQWLAKALTFGDSVKRESLLTWSRLNVPDPGRVETLLLCLSDKNPKVRFIAARDLSFHKPAAVENIIMALNDPDWEVRRWIAYCLGQMKNPQALDRLYERLNDQNPHVRASVAEAIGKINDPKSIPYLDKRLKIETNEYARGYILHALTDIGTEQAIDIVLQAHSVKNDQAYFIALNLAKKGTKQVLEKAQVIFATGDDQSRFTLARTLGLINDASTVDLLVKALNDPNQEVFAEAAVALAKKGSSEATRAIKEILRQPTDPWVYINIYLAYADRKDPALLDNMIDSLQDDNEWMHGYAAMALGKIGDPRAVEPLIDLLLDPSKKHRSQAAEALGRLNAISAIPALVQALDESDEAYSWPRIHTAWALGELRATEAVQVLIHALHIANNNDESTDVLCEALGKIADPRAVDELVLALKSDYPSSWAAWALGKIGDPRAVAPLQNILEHSTSEVRLAAISALTKINNPAAALALLPVLENENAPGWMVALKGLSRNGHPAAVPVLIRHLQNPSVVISKLAGKALAKTGQPAVEMLLELIRSPDPIVRRRVVWILGEIGGSKAQHRLAAALNDPDWRVRYKAAQALGKNPAAHTILERALKDPVPQVQVPARAILKRKKSM